MTFDPQARKIYRFYDGQKQRGVDPLEIYLALQKTGVDWDAKFTLLKAHDLTVAEELVEAGRKVFDLRKFEIAADGTESGLTTVEVLDVLAGFLEFVYETTNFTDPPQTSPPSTEDNPEATASGAAGIGTSPGNLSDAPLPSAVA